jgi:hypothetical protein
MPFVPNWYPRIPDAVAQLESFDRDLLARTDDLGALLGVSHARAAQLLHRFHARPVGSQLVLDRAGLIRSLRAIRRGRPANGRALAACPTAPAVIRFARRVSPRTFRMAARSRRRSRSPVTSRRAQQNSTTGATTRSRSTRSSASCCKRRSRCSNQCGRRALVPPIAQTGCHTVAPPVRRHPIQGATCGGRTR